MWKMRGMIRTLFPALLCLTCAAPAIAEQAATMGGGVARVSLIDGWRTDDGKVVAAVAVDLAPGWHTYWRDPGDVGMPPVFDWSGSRDLGSVAIDWPAPEVFENDYGRSIGYAGAWSCRSR